MTGITEYADVVSFNKWISGAFLWEDGLLSLLHLRVLTGGLHSGEKGGEEERYPQHIFLPGRGKAHGKAGLGLWCPLLPIALTSMF